MPFRFFQIMGTLTCSRKRADEVFSVNSPWSSRSSSRYSFYPLDSRVSKKKKVSHMHQSPERVTSSRSSVVSRLSRYPEPKQPFRRVVHAPCGPRFGSLYRRGKESGGFEGRTCEVSHEGEPGGMGNISTRYRETKVRAYETIPLFKGLLGGKEKGKEKVISDDSSIEEVGFVEDGQEGGSVVLNDSLQEENGLVLQTSMVSEGEMADRGIVPASSTEVQVDTKVDHLRRKLSFWSLNHGHHVDITPAYKKLLTIAAGRDPILKNLDFEIRLTEKQLLSQLFEPRLKKLESEEDSVREPFLPLTNEEEEEVERAFKCNRKEILVSHEGSNIEITGEVLQCLRPGAWLNDEVINLYLELLKEREKREPKKFLKCHFFNTFFYKKLIGGRTGYDYKSVRRWTSQKKLGYYLSECEKIFVPIHQEVHWCLAVINNKDQKFQYLDSLGGRDTQVLRVLAKYYVDEVKDKNQQDIDVSSWEFEYADDLPEQENGSDCGVFMVKYTDFYSRGLKLQFSQENMPYFRRRTAKEILKVRAD